MRLCGVCAGVCLVLVLGLAAVPARAQEANGRHGAALAAGLPGGDGGSRFATVNRRRALEERRLDLEHRRRNAEQGQRDGERSAREARRDAGINMTRLKRILSTPGEERPKDGEVQGPNEDPERRAEREFRLRRLDGDWHAAETTRRRLQDLGRQMGMERRAGSAVGHGTAGLRGVYLKSLR